MVSMDTLLKSIQDFAGDGFHGYKTCLSPKEGSNSSQRWSFYRGSTCTCLESNSSSKSTRPLQKYMPNRSPMRGNVSREATAAIIRGRPVVRRGVPSIEGRPVVKKCPIVRRGSEI